MHKTKLIINLATFVVDYLLVMVAFVLAYFFRDHLNGVYLISFDQFFIFSLFAALIYILIFIYLGLYTVERYRGLADQLFSITIGALSATMIAGSIIYFARSFDYSRLIVGTALVLSILLVWLGRIIMYWIEQYLYARGSGVVQVLLIGSGGSLDMAIKSYAAETQRAYRLVGILLTQEEDQPTSTGIKILGNTKDNNIDDLITQLDINEVVLADTTRNEKLALQIIDSCERLGIRFKYVPDMFDVVSVRMIADNLAGMPIIELRSTMLEGWMVIGKRILDVVLAGGALVILSPFLLIIAIMIKKDSKGPTFFRHYRVGRNGKEFEVLKFRSMSMVIKDGQMLHSSANEAVEELKEKNPNYKLEHDPRVTRIGHFIRRTSIDELPQFWNVVKGDMSLVGPRPYLAKELEKQQESYPHTKALVQRLLTVKPGVTGLWQVSGRSEIEFTERVSMDAYYATHANIWLDIKILLQTVPVVLKGSGAM